MLAITVLAMFCFLVVVISLFGYMFYARPSRAFKRLGHSVLPAAEGVEPDEGASPLMQAFGAIGRKLPVSLEHTTSTRHDLLAAGFRSERAVPVYYGMKVVSAGAVAALAYIAVSEFSMSMPLPVVAIAIALLAGSLLPGLVLEYLIERRQEEIRFSLPDVLDLMVVCVEAGQGLDQALLTVSRELQSTHPLLCSELTLMNLEMRAGMRRAEALHNLAERTAEKEVRKLVAILVQTDRFGTSIAEALRSHSVFMRKRRKLDAEERAAKIGVKLVFPIFLFMLPAMLVIAAGPGLLLIFKGLFPVMRNFRGF
ncbi:MAG: type II secretion system F family protein [Bryobacteraceae bacterium]